MSDEAGPDHKKRTLPMKNGLRLQGKFFVYFSGLILLILIVVSIAIFYFQKQLLLKQIQDKTFSLTGSLAYTSLNAVLQENYLVLQGLIDSMMDDEQIVSIDIVDTLGKIIASSAPESREIYLQDASIRNALSFQRMIIQKTRDAAGREIWDITVPIMRLNQQIGIARMKYSVEDPLSGLLQSILVIGIVAFLLSLLLAYRASRSVTRPIRAAVQLAAEYGRGNLDASIIMNRRDEIGELVVSLNKLSQELKTLIEEKVANENLVMMGEFASYIIHDLKNPLSGIHLLSDGLHRKIPPESPLKKYATEILLATQKLHDFVEKTLDVSRWNRLNLQEANLREIIEKTLRDIETGRIIVKTEIDPNIPPVNVDYQMLSMAIKNLLSNSVEAISGEGHIWVAASWTDNYLTISIRDDGCGIPQGSLNTIFRPFYSMKKQGHGLGLAMVRKAVVLHRGKIQVESQEGMGSTFTITIPGNLEERQSWQ